MMKLDMGGAAHALALAGMIMDAGLAMRLRVLIPAVENAIGADAVRPLDVVRARNGLTIEIANTDVEGRLVLADALAEAATENPELIVDFATLTSASMVALGPDIAAMFSNDDAVAADLHRKCRIHANMCASNRLRGKILTISGPRVLAGDGRHARTSLNNGAVS